MLAFNEPYPGESTLLMLLDDEKVGLLSSNSSTMPKPME